MLFFFFLQKKSNGDWQLAFSWQASNLKWTVNFTAIILNLWFLLEPFQRFPNSLAAVQLICIIVCLRWLDYWVLFYVKFLVSLRQTFAQRMRGMGSIQEDRHKVEQFHFLWNSIPKMWNSSPKSGAGPVSGSQFHKLWNRGPSVHFKISRNCIIKRKY